MPQIDTTTGQQIGAEGNVQVSGSEVTQHGGVAQVTLQTDEPGDKGRPSWLPEGFDTPEAFRAAYDKMRSGDTTEETLSGTAQDDTLQASEGTDKVVDEEALKASLKEAGGIYADPRYEPFAIEFEKTGELAPESVKAAATAFGVPENAVTDFIAGQKALRENAGLKTTASEQAQVDSLMTTAGLTPEVYRGEFNTWATENIPQADLDAYNNMTDLNAASLVLKGWSDKFKASTRTPADITRGASGSAPGGKPEPTITPFASMAEQLAAQGSREYATDPTARKAIEARIKISNY